jgi:hypothetical protein
MEHADIYVAACGKPLSSYSLGKQHERSCGRCQAILRGDDQEDEETEEEESDDE